MTLNQYLGKWLQTREATTAYIAYDTCDNK